MKRRRAYPLSLGIIETVAVRDLRSRSLKVILKESNSISCRKSGSGLRHIPPLSLTKQALQSQRQSHIAGDSKLPGHESHLAVKLAVEHVEIVRGRHRQCDVG